MKDDIILCCKHDWDSWELNENSSRRPINAFVCDNNGIYCVLWPFDHGHQLHTGYIKRKLSAEHFNLFVKTNL